MSVYVIGDIHGCYYTFLKLLKKINFNLKKDTLIGLGDYINKGSCSKEVLDWFINNKGNFVLLKGNHEDNFLKQPSNPDPSFLESFDDNISEYYVEWMHDNLLNYYEDENFIYVHAGIDPNKNTLEDQNDYDLFNRRGDFITSHHNFDRPIIFGHTSVVETIKMFNNTIPLDTGCVYDNKLSIMNTKTNEITSCLNIDERWTNSFNKLKFNLFSNLVNEFKYQYEIGWWMDNQTNKVYHGTSLLSLDSILKNGLMISNEEYVMCSLDPNTSRGYSMYRNGHQDCIRNKRFNYPDERVILEIQLETQYILENILPLNFCSKISFEQLSDHKKYIKFQKSDAHYYKYTELIFTKNIPPENIKVFCNGDC